MHNAKVISYLKLKNLCSIHLNRTCKLIMKKSMGLQLLNGRQKRFLRLAGVFFAFLFIRSLDTEPETPTDFQTPINVLCHTISCNAHQLVKKIRLVHDARQKVVFCGSEKCMDTLQSESKYTSNLLAIRVRVPDLVKGTPLECFLSESTRIKLNMGAEFLKSSQDIISLLLMWHNKGQFISQELHKFYFRYPHRLKQKRLSKRMVVSKEGVTESVNILETEAPEIHEVMKFIARGIKETGKLQIDMNKVFTAVNDGDAFDEQYFTGMPPSRSKKHYGILSYDHSAAITRESNIGDEIQALTGLQFLPYNDVFLDRDTWKVLPKDVRCIYNSTLDKDPAKRKLLVHGKECSIMARKDSVTAFLNAWYGRSRQHWPPPASVDPVLISMYAGPLVREMFSTRSAVSYLRKRGPVGARDTGTLEFFNLNNIPAFLSACATLMFRRNQKQSSEYFLADVKGIDTKNIIPKEIHKKMTKLTHIIKQEIRFDRITRLTKAVGLIDLYSSAKLVITARIHVALPCVAMGVPVIFLNSEHLPGGGGNRTAGLLNLFHTFQVPEESKKLKKFNFENPPPNPNHELVLKYRARMWHVLRKREDLRDTAITYGLIPFKRYGTPPKKLHKFIVSLLTENDIKFSRMSLESILELHPFAKVLVHYSEESLAENLREYYESGYDIEFRKTDLESIAEAVKYQENFEFYEKITAFQKRVTFYKKILPRNFYLEMVKQVINLCVMYAEGGIFVDSRLLLLKPVDKIAEKILYFKSPRSHSKIAFMHARKSDAAIKREIMRVSERPLLGRISERSEASKIPDVEWDFQKRMCEAKEKFAEKHIGMRLKSGVFHKVRESALDIKCKEYVESRCIICA